MNMNRLWTSPDHIRLVLPQDQVSYLTSEYEDAAQRARRLSASRENILTGRGNPANLLCQDDVVIYLRWLVCHLHSVQTVHNFLKVKVQFLMHLSLLYKAFGVDFFFLLFWIKLLTGAALHTSLWEKRKRAKWGNFTKVSTCWRWEAHQQYAWNLHLETVTADSNKKSPLS